MRWLSSLREVDVDLPKVSLNTLPRIVRQRNEGLSLSTPPLGHIATHLVVAACVPLLHQTAKNLHRRVALFPRGLFIVLENLADQRLEMTPCGQNTEPISNSQREMEL